MISDGIRIAVILNGISRRKSLYYNSIHPVLSGAFPVNVFETQHAEHARHLGKEVVRDKDKYSHVIAAGGDGTLHQVLNGVLSATPAEPHMLTFGVVPLGTGNDFARTCGITASGSELVKTIQSGGKPTDIGSLICADDLGVPQQKYFVNVASLGMGPEVVKRLVGDKRLLGPDLTYLKAILAAFISHRSLQIHIKSTDWEFNELFRVIAMANGRTFGHRITVGPDAMVDDGILSVFLARDMPWWKFIYSLQLAKMGRRIKQECVQYRTAKSLVITSPTPAAVEAEGEWQGWLPAEIQVLPGAIRFLRQ
ncbi:MAG: diacylglycerol kinase family lipid kinase [Bacteroidetes bacterium]|nr:diacylglycerol kinase family lipid kinase [Bacteroidota bacterium]MBS1977219.1 diacylglycerol kinase family lipid kinase [Bacteroidota bacterium]